MDDLTVAKFGGSAIGPDGSLIPVILGRIDSMRRNAKVVAVFSAPLTVRDGRPRSLTDVVLGLGGDAAGGREPDMRPVRLTYDRILASTGAGDSCRGVVDSYLGKAEESLLRAAEAREFAGEVRSLALAYSGEILMSHVMAHVLRDRGVRARAVELEDWPIVTDENIEFANFLYRQSAKMVGPIKSLVEGNDVVSIGGFIGRTAGGTVTTYERGGSDRTAADIGILLHREYRTQIDFEKDSAVASADPKVVSIGRGAVRQMSYNEARLAGMFGMKILDPIVIKEVLENGVDMPLVITDMKDPKNTTVIRRRIDGSGGHPLKIVAGRKNCAIVRLESDASHAMQKSLRQKMRYSEYVVLSPFTRDGTDFSRILFLDGDYVRWGEKYIRSFDPLASITYGRGAVTMIGDEMWRLRHTVSRASASVGDAGLNILNIDAQEETSRITIIVEDAGDNVENAIRSVHATRDAGSWSRGEARP